MRRVVRVKRKKKYRGSEEEKEIYHEKRKFRKNFPPAPLATLTNLVSVLP